MSRRALFPLSAGALLACTACAAGDAPTARGGKLVTADERVRVQKPAGEGWRCLSRRLERQGAARFYSFVHCEIQTHQGDLTLELVDREMDPVEEVPPVEELCKKRYPELHRTEHPDVRVAGVRAIAHQGRPGCEVILDATDEGGQPIRIVDRIFVVRTHILHGTATAAPALLMARQGDVERWFAGASFASLK